MSQSSGTGSPVWFMCGACRHARGSARQHESVAPPVSIVLTGRTRKYTPATRSALGARSARVSRQYECQRCWHVGWSNHMDLARMVDPEASRRRS